MAASPAIKKDELNLPSQYALRVALQTMKERCVALQQRVTIVEEENHQLREQMDQNAITTPTKRTDNSMEKMKLSLQIAELERQKSQLNDHINMVSNENRKLWSRLSKIAKEQVKNISPETTLISPDSPLSQSRTKILSRFNSSEDTCTSSVDKQNLIRSKTFTQHSPNPNLRHKLVITNDNIFNADNMKDLSFEEVTLEACNEDGWHKSSGEYLRKETCANESYAKRDDMNLGFSYLNVNENAEDLVDADFESYSKMFSDGLEELRKEALQQKDDLSSALAVLEKRFALTPKSLKPETADKSLETDESLTEGKFSSYSRKYGGVKDGEMLCTTVSKGHKEEVSTSSSPSHLNIIQEKINADGFNKTCPMCGVIFSPQISFGAFERHVESHFIDEMSDNETSIENNYEFISHAVGNF